MALPQGFVYLNDVDASILQEMKYLTDDNFLGRPVKGYVAPRCILTAPAAAALAKIQKQMNAQGLSLKVFDCYRPQIAVDDFVAWSEDECEKMKTRYYPNITKKEFFTLGYASERSSHTRGSAVDLTLVRLDKGSEVSELDMGGIFDFMDPLSHPDNKNISAEAYENRMMLRSVMLENGFEPIETEWWHFTLVDEPFPETYFNFVVE